MVCVGVTRTAQPNQQRKRSHVGVHGLCLLVAMSALAAALAGCSSASSSTQSATEGSTELTVDTRNGPLTVSTTTVPDLCSLATETQVGVAVNDVRSWHLETVPVTTPTASGNITTTDQVGSSCAFTPVGENTQDNESAIFAQITTETGADALAQNLNTYANNVELPLGDQAFYKTSFPEQIFFRVDNDWFDMDLQIDNQSGSIDFPRSQAASRTLVSQIVDRVRALKDAPAPIPSATGSLPMYD